MLWCSVISDVRLPVPSKVTSVRLSAPLIRSELHLRLSDGSQAQVFLHTNNDKVDSIPNPLEPAINLVPNKDMIEATIKL